MDGHNFPGNLDHLSVNLQGTVSLAAKGIAPPVGLVLQRTFISGVFVEIRPPWK